jgi:hypothetical protein
LDPERKSEHGQDLQLGGDMEKAEGMSRTGEIGDLKYISPGMKRSVPKR